MTLVINQNPEDKEFDNFELGNFPIMTGPAVILSGENLLKGTALAIYTGGSDEGKCVGLDGDLSDGGNVPYAILLEDVDASAEDKNTIVALSGQFNIDEVILVDSTDDIADFVAGFRDKNIYLKEIAKNRS